MRNLWLQLWGDGLLLFEEREGELLTAEGLVGEEEGRLRRRERFMVHMG